MEGVIIIKILLVHSGTKPSGSTMRAVYEAESEFQRLGISSDVFWLGNEAVFSCRGCGACKKTGECFLKDAAYDLSMLVKDYDGFIFFTPVHYAGASGNMISALSRLFFSKKCDLQYKPAAATSVSRRGGNVSALEEIERYFHFADMPVISGNYPGIIHGTVGDEIECDLEGLQTVRSIARNMTWIMRCIEAARKCGIYPEPEEEKIKTSYIRPNG
jgi:multimeric flavodoxin WrbA